MWCKKMQEHWADDLEMQIEKVGGVKNITSNIKVDKNVY